MTKDQDNKKPTGPKVISDFVRHLPNRPGVYRMINPQGDVLYVGKARNLKKRVTSYTKLGGHTNRIARMIADTAQMEFVTTASEVEALLLEANLIKKFKPRYNVLLRDDKSFPYILVRKDHPFAQIQKHRGAQSIKGDYFGPFASAHSVTRTLNTLQRAFLLRSCSDHVFENRSRPCLLYQIRRCCAPCTGNTSEQDYRELVTHAEEFLKGRNNDLQDQLKQDMETASQNLEFERAAALRDRIKAMTHIHLTQGINAATLQDADVISAYVAGGQSCIQVFFFRAGQNWGNRAYFPRHDAQADQGEILGSFIAQFYENKPSPKLILTSHQPFQCDLLQEALSLKTERKVTIKTPERGERKKLIDHATTNAKEALGRRLSEKNSQRKLLEQLADIFELESPPERIEIYDNSHIQGTNAVGGMVVAGLEGFEKNQYRKFNIKDEQITPGDDYAMMREVLTRRFARLVKQDSDANANKKSSGAQWPDLILIDGGAGQLSIAEEVFAELGIGNVTLVSIAKGPDRDAGREKFLMPGKQPFMIEPNSPVLYYLQRLRDEAHRFAIGSHRARRKKAISSNPLDEVQGIGAARKKALLTHFGSARAVSNASIEDLANVIGISKSMATKIHEYFHD